ncbi:MAG: helix-turn-helix transcriptional regulator [Ruminococcaceae bacterium]|nr:helix-turn-helix transcriptional regulator [Oscillospiraceae bacterium]
MKKKAEIGISIAYYRKEKEMTQRELAQLLGVCTQSVSKWEQQISCPDVMLLPEIAKAFDITIDELFKFNKLKPKGKRIVKKAT